MRPCSGRLVALGAVVATLWACAGPRVPIFTETQPFEHRRPAAVPLPDKAERTAAKLAAFALAGRPDSAAAALQQLDLEERQLREEGNSGTGLIDNGRDLLHTLAGPRGYREQTVRMLEEEKLDPALRRRLENYLDRDPLRVAEQRLREDWLRKLAATLNRLTLPLSRIATTGLVNPVETGQAAIATLLVFHSFPEATPQERQALHAYEEFLDRNPDSPEADWVVERVEHYQQKWLRQLHGEAVDVAKQSLEAGRPDVCLAHLDRAERLLPGDPETLELRAEAEQTMQERTERVERALSAVSVVGVSLDSQAQDLFYELAGEALTANPEEVAARARGFEARHGPGPLSDEMLFVEGLETRQPGDEDPFFDSIEEVARLRTDWSNMARHARWILTDPEQDPYLYYRGALRADRNDRLLYVFVGRHRRGPPRRGLPRPVEWILALPGIAISVVLTPIRLLQYRSVRSRFGAGVIDTGERYLRRFPTGAHSQEVHRELENRCAQRGRWSRALEHHQARGDPDPDTVARYRERIAGQALAAAQLERRWDVRAMLYRQILREYPDTPQAEVSRRELRTVLTETTPQKIRLSRGFLLENPELWGPGALGLRRELLDGEEGNGELAEEGVTLIGQTYVQVALEGRDPVIQALPEDQFARFVALLQEVYYQKLVTDERERPEIDPQRDLFFERARLGLLEHPDTRPTASSEATFLSSREKHGFMRREEPLIPVELVVSGGLESFGLTAYPRIRAPAESDDAWLYR